MSARETLQARLAAADPARSFMPDARARELLWGRIQAGEGASSALLPAARRDRRSGRVLLAAALLVALLAAAALAAGGVIPFGSPAKLPFSTLPTGREGPDALQPGSVRLVPIAASDPDGGPPWGMRMLSTKRGQGCLEIGRLQDGKLGAIGRDGAFHGDGAFHELPLNAIDINGCTQLDGRGRLFTNVTAASRPASAWPGSGALLGGCVPKTAGRYERAGASICPQRDLRNIYFGLLGPRARSITYVLGGERHTLDTVGPDGAYMFVTRASPHQLLNFADASAAGIVPVDGPIRAILYRDGSICHLTAKSWIGGAYACTPSLPEPYGYTPVGSAPTAAQAAARVHASVRRGRHGRPVLTISFRAPVAIAGDRRIYSIHVHRQGDPAGVYTGMTVERDVAAGALIRRALGEFGPRLRGGLITGTVTLRQQIGAGGLEGPGSVGVPVGRFSVRVP